MELIQTSQGFFRKQLQSLLGSHICSSVLDLHIGCCPSVRGNFNSLQCIYLIFLKQETLNEEQDYIPDMFPPQATTHFGIIAATEARLPNPSLAHMNLQ